MLRRGSRYQDARRFEPEAGGEPVFAGIRPREIGPATGVVEHVVQTGERLDLLANHYYRDARLWWRIVDANPRLVFVGVILGQEMEGEVILIPKARE